MLAGVDTDDHIDILKQQIYIDILPFAPPLILGDLKPGNVLLDDRLDDPSGRELTAEEPLISGLSC